MFENLIETIKTNRSYNFDKFQVKFENQQTERSFINQNHFKLQQKYKYYTIFMLSTILYSLIIFYMFSSINNKHMFSSYFIILLVIIETILYSKLGSYVFSSKRKSKINMSTLWRKFFLISYFFHFEIYFMEIDTKWRLIYDFIISYSALNELSIDFKEDIIVIILPSFIMMFLKL